MDYKHLGDLIRAESFRYIYLVKESLIGQINYKEFRTAKNLDELDFLLSQALKALKPLHLICDKNYGDLVNYQNIPNSKTHLELYRSIENYNQWQERYIQKEVSDLITNAKKSQHKPNIFLKNGTCPDVFITHSLFKPQFCEDFREEARNKIDEFKVGYSYHEFTKSLPLWKLGLEEDWHNFVKFFVSSSLCSTFIGQIIPMPEGGYYVTKHVANEVFQFEGFSTNVELQVIIPLDNGASIYFQR